MPCLISSTWGSFLFNSLLATKIRMQVSHGHPQLETYFEFVGLQLGVILDKSEGITRTQESQECFISATSLQKLKKRSFSMVQGRPLTPVFPAFSFSSCHYLKCPLCISTHLTLVSPFVWSISSKKEVTCLLAALFPKHRTMPGIWCVPCKYLVDHMIAGVISLPGLPFLSIRKHCF